MEFYLKFVNYVLSGLESLNDEGSLFDIFSSTSLFSCCL